MIFCKFYSIKINVIKSNTIIVDFNVYSIVYKDLQRSLLFNCLIATRLILGNIRLHRHKDLICVRIFDLDYIEQI